MTTSAQQNDRPPFVNAKDLKDRNITFDILGVRTVNFTINGTATTKWVLDIQYTHPRHKTNQLATVTFFYNRKSGNVNRVLADLLEPIHDNAFTGFPVVDATIGEHTMSWKDKEGQEHNFTELVPVFTLPDDDDSTIVLDDEHPF